MQPSIHLVITLGLVHRTNLSSRMRTWLSSQIGNSLNLECKAFTESFLHQAQHSSLNAIVLYW